MFLKLVSVAILAIATGCGAASAQSVNDFGGPKELPPAGFKGQQFVDSRGCVFLKAGFGGQVNWVPRVSSNRKQLCGYPPSFGGATETATAEQAPAPAPKRVAQAAVAAAKPAAPARVAKQAAVPTASYLPGPVVMSAPAAAPRQVMVQPKAQVVATARRGAGAEVVAGGAGKGKIGCYADAPIAERLRLQGGGTIVLCTSGNGDLTNARPPIVLGGPAAVAASGYLETGARVGDQVVISTQDNPKIAKGYKAAWQDDRLNTKRGVGSAQGWAEQDQVWTRKFPSRLVQDTPRRKKIVSVPAAAGKVSVSSMGSAAAGQGAYVQVGTFGQPANADGASARLAGLGLPVARARIVKSGKALQIVMAGPFGSAGEAQAALHAARKAGFTDAFLR